MLRGLLLFLISLNASAGTLSLYRWENGYKASNHIEQKLSINEEDFSQFLKSGRHKSIENRQLFKGCYLAHFDRGVTQARSPASVKPKEELHRICFLPNQ